MIAQDMYELGAKRSCIRELFEYGMKQAALVGKENVFDFSIGNPSIPAPAAVDETFAALPREGDSLALHGYTMAGGDADARAAVTAELNSRFGTRLEPKNLFFTCGAAPALIAAIRALAVEGAEFVAMAPYFAEYRPFVEGNGGRFVPVAAAPDFRIPLAGIEAAITARTQAVIVNSPNNPSGVVYTRAELEELAALLRRKGRELGHPIYILADEPYRELVYDGIEAPFIPTIYENTVVCYSYSKSLSLPGERIGYFCVPDEAADSGQLLAALAGAARVLGHVCAPSLQQRVVARCAAVRPDMEAYDRNRSTLYDALTAYGYDCVKPQGAFYMFVKAPGGSAAAFSQRAKEKNLLVVPGDDFGCPTHFRVCTCVAHEMLLRSLPVFQELVQ